MGVTMTQPFRLGETVQFLDTPLRMTVAGFVNGRIRCEIPTKAMAGGFAMEFDAAHLRRVSTTSSEVPRG
jgi:hypothetical protein